MLHFGSLARIILGCVHRVSYVSQLLITFIPNAIFAQNKCGYLSADVSPILLVISLFIQNMRRCRIDVFDHERAHFSMSQNVYNSFLLLDCRGLFCVASSSSCSRLISLLKLWKVRASVFKKGLSFVIFSFPFCCRRLATHSDDTRLPP